MPNVRKDFAGEGWRRVWVYYDTMGIIIIALKLMLMKTSNKFLTPLFFCGYILLFPTGCKKEDNTPVLPATTVTDIDGNVYHTITIGTQVWMVENLKVTHYRNGDPIPHVSEDTAWGPLTPGPAYCNYDNSGITANTYGRLYNWYAVADGPFIAPAGWHIPSEAEFTTLSNYLGGDWTGAAPKLTETGSAHWQSADTATATNESGFTALPGGSRSEYGVFGYLQTSGGWWCSTEKDNASAWLRVINGYFGYANAHKNTGRSVRCIKD